MFRANLEETGMGYGLEVECVAAAHGLGLLTTPYVFDERQAVDMTAAGADILVAHMGLTVGGSIFGGTTTNSGSVSVEGAIRVVKIGGDLLGGGGPGSGNPGSGRQGTGGGTKERRCHAEKVAAIR